MADKKISQLTSAATINDADVFALVQGGVTKQIPFSVIKTKFLQPANNLNDVVSVSAARSNLDVYSTTETVSQINSIIASNQTIYNIVDGDCLNGVTVSTSTNPVRLRKRFNHVSMEGEFKINTNLSPGNSICTLPVGYRPLRSFLLYEVYDLLNISGTRRFIYLMSSGLVVYVGSGAWNATTFMTVNHINFEAN